MKFSILSLAVSGKSVNSSVFETIGDTNYFKTMLRILHISLFDKRYCPKIPISFTEKQFYLFRKNEFKGDIQDPNVV